MPTKTAPIDISALESFANELADLAVPASLELFRHPLDIERKEDSSPVTIADRRIETILRKAIAGRYPGHGIFGEEHGAEHLDRRHVWVVDPIDGTKSFISGWPLFGTLIACLEDGKPVVGVISMPAIGERWSARRGGQARFAGKPCAVSRCTRLAKARIYTTSPDAFDEAERALYLDISSRAALRRFGGDCYSYGLLASGHVDAVIEMQLQPYDYMALVPVIEAAGGVITDWSGQPLTLDSPGRVVAAATRELHAELLALLGADAPARAS